LVNHPVQIRSRRIARPDVSERIAAVQFLAAGGQVYAG
jgi:hypothetical protein